VRRQAAKKFDMERSSLKNLNMEVGIGANLSSETISRTQRRHLGENTERKYEDFS
jgi:hypothetical protein